MNREERLEEVKKAHQRYVDWWLPIDVAGGSFLAPMSCHRFCETLLTHDEFWKSWLNITEPKEKYLMKLFLLAAIIMHHTNQMDLNEK